MKPKHTPGPWRIETENETGIPTISIRDGLNQQIATVNPYRLAWRDADAHLIAAAPDMLWALECVESELIDVGMEVPDYITTAIAKAKGEL